MVVRVVLVLKLAGQESTELRGELLGLLLDHRKSERSDDMPSRKCALQSNICKRPPDQCRNSGRRDRNGVRDGTMGDTMGGTIDGTRVVRWATRWVT